MANMPHPKRKTTLGLQPPLHPVCERTARQRGNLSAQFPLASPETSRRNFWTCDGEPVPRGTSSCNPGTTSIRFSQTLQTAMHVHTKKIARGRPSRHTNTRAATSHHCGTFPSRLQYDCSAALRGDPWIFHGHAVGTARSTRPCPPIEGTSIRNWSSPTACWSVPPRSAWSQLSLSRHHSCPGPFHLLHEAAAAVSGALAQVCRQL